MLNFGPRQPIELYMNYGYGWKKNKLERKARARKKNPLSLARVSAQVQLCETEEVAVGRVFLHDLTEDGVGVFLSRPITKGTKVFFVLEQPRHLFLRGEIAWCGIYRLNTRVISPENFQYRAGIRFIYESQADRELIRNYFRELFLRGLHVA